MAHDAKIDALQISLAAKIEESHSATAKEIATLRHSHDAKLQSAKYDIIKWIYPALIAMSGLTIAILKLLE